MHNLPVYTMFTPGTVKTANRREGAQTLSSWPDKTWRRYTLQPVFRAIQQTMNSMCVDPAR